MWSVAEEHFDDAGFVGIAELRRQGVRKQGRLTLMWT